MSKGAMRAVMIVVTAGALFCVGWLIVAPSRAQEGEDVVRTVTLGLKNRHEKVYALQGTAVASTYYEPDKLAVMRGALPANPPPPPELEFNSRGLQELAFWLDLRDERWRIEVAELMSTGWNEWGFPRNLGMRGTKSSLTPVLVETCDGSAITRWEVTLGSASVSSIRPEMPAGGSAIRHRLQDFLLLPSSGPSDQRFVSEGREKVGDLDCYRLALRADKYSSVSYWVAPDKGFALVKRVEMWMDEKKLGRGFRREMVATSWVEVADGLWLPSETHMNSYLYQPDRDRALCESHVLRFRDLAANQEIPALRFAGQLPLGTIVHQGEKRTEVGDTGLILLQYTRNPVPPRYDEAYCTPPRIE